MRFLNIKYKVLSFFVIFCISSYANAATYSSTSSAIIQKTGTGWRPPLYKRGTYNITQYKKINISIVENGKNYPISVYVYGENGVNSWFLDNTAKVITNMIGSMKSGFNASKLNNYEFFLVNKIVDACCTSYNSIIVDTPIICSTIQGTYRSWDTPIHEFGHAINMRSGTEQEQINACQNYGNVAPPKQGEYDYRMECVAWASEFWFNTIQSAYFKKSIPPQKLQIFRQKLSNSGVKFKLYFPMESRYEQFFNNFYKKYFYDNNSWQPTCNGRPSL